MLTIAINRAILQTAAVLLKIDVLNSHSISIEGAWALHYPVVPVQLPLGEKKNIPAICLSKVTGENFGTSG